MSNIYSRRDTFAMLIGAAALAAVPTLIGATPQTAVAVALATGDLLPADGGWFNVADFPVLAKFMREEESAPERDGMIQLPLCRPYTQYEGLADGGQGVWAHYSHYVKAIPSGPNHFVGGANGLIYADGVGWIRRSR